jgi:hypothetical protein
MEEVYELRMTKGLEMESERTSVRYKGLHGLWPQQVHAT